MTMSARALGIALGAFAGLAALAPAPSFAQAGAAPYCALFPQNERPACARAYALRQNACAMRARTQAEGQQCLAALNRSLDACTKLVPAQRPACIRRVLGMTAASPSPASPAAFCASLPGAEAVACARAYASKQNVCAMRARTQAEGRQCLAALNRSLDACLKRPPAQRPACTRAALGLKAP